MVDSAGERISSASSRVPMYQSASVPVCHSARVPECQCARVPSQSVPPSTILSLSCLDAINCTTFHTLQCTSMERNVFYPRWRLFRFHTLQCTECSTWDKTQSSAQWYLARWIIVGQCSVSQQSLSLSLCGHSSSSSSTPTTKAS